MIYSGVDLIRNSDQQHARAERLAETSRVEAAEPVSAASANLSDEDSRGALLRFARFVSDEKERRPRATPKDDLARLNPGQNPYQARAKREMYRDHLGTFLDIRV